MAARPEPRLRGGFEKIKHYAGLWLVKLALLVLVWAYCHHFCAGIRFLFLDLDKGVDLATARLTSWSCSSSASR